MRDEQARRGTRLLRVATARRLAGERLLWPYNHALPAQGVDVTGLLEVWLDIQSEDPRAADRWGPPIS